MEEKKIRLIEKNENAILGQESVFGWELKSKERIKNVVFFKANEYTLVRNRDESEVTQAHKDVEARWDELFDKWNNKFIFKTYPFYIYAILASFVLLIICLIISLLDIPLEGLIACWVILTLLLIGEIAIIVLLIPKIKKINDLDKISREMRQVNSIRKAKSSSNLSNLKVAVINETLSEENLNGLKVKLLNTFQNKELFKICDINKNETNYQVLFEKEDFKLHILLPIRKDFENSYLKISNSIGEEFWVNDNKVDVDVNSDNRFIPIDGLTKVIKIKWLISCPENGELKKFELMIELPIAFEIQ